jgi:peptide/nickel transport system substrate-binding protein
LATPKLLPLVSAFPDYTRYIDTVRALEAKYAYNLDKAKEVVTQRMTELGAELGADGKWTYKGKPITLVFLIRTEDARKLIGDYVANQLEALGFTVDRQYKTRTEASPIWVKSDPAEGLWNLYTGGWITTAVERDAGSNFAFFYTNLLYPIPLHQAYTPQRGVLQRRAAAGQQRL